MLTELLITRGFLDRIDLDVKLVVKLVDAEDVLFIWLVQQWAEVLPILIGWIIKQMHILEAIHRVRFKRTKVLISVQNKTGPIHGNLADLLILVFLLYLVQ